jgi:type II secretory pathway component GspD/PulD (secretin)
VPRAEEAAVHAKIGKTHVLLLKHAKASEVAQILNGIADGLVEGDTPEDIKGLIKAVASEHGNLLFVIATPGQIRLVQQLIGMIDLPRVERAEPFVLSLHQAKASEAKGIIEQLAGHSVLSGDVKIAADDRTGQLLILTRPENMVFFKAIIKALDTQARRESSAGNAGETTGQPQAPQPVPPPGK